MSERRNHLSTTSNTSLLLCPFFVSHAKQDIMCEGLIDRCRTVMKFEKEEDKKWHQVSYCENQYTRCEMYCSIMHWKWPDED